MFLGETSYSKEVIRNPLRLFQFDQHKTRPSVMPMFSVLCSTGSR